MELGAPASTLKQTAPRALIRITHSRETQEVMRGRQHTPLVVAPTELRTLPHTPKDLNFLMSKESCVLI